MSFEILGETKGLAPAQRKAVEKLYRRSIDPDELVSLDLAREICELSASLRRMIGLLVDRDGSIEMVFLGTKQIIYLPDLGRYRLGASRLRRLRFIFSDISKNEEPKIPNDIYTDLEKLRFDAVVALKQNGKSISAKYAYLTGLNRETLDSEEAAPTSTKFAKDLGRLKLDFKDFIFEIESDLARGEQKQSGPQGNRAVLVGIYDKRQRNYEASIAELKELAKSSGVIIADTIIQRRDLDPKTLIGKGKLEELVLRCLRLDASHIVFDTELRPSQWRSIVNSTDLKVLDRSMLILDIFSQRASSADGRLQVELAQLKYNLPRLTEEDSGLSRLSGGIGGRGPGETKLEVSRRRARDRIAELERRIAKVGKERSQRREKRKEKEIPLVAILGYTNVGKSTLFNLLTKGTALVENKLFATLDPTVKKLVFPSTKNPDSLMQLLISDTVGFIRDLPSELVAAFKATLEELEEASLFLHVLDISDPEIEARKESVLTILKELNLHEVPTLYVLNKSDLVSGENCLALTNQFEGIAVSAKNGTGIKELRIEIEDRII